MKLLYYNRIDFSGGIDVNKTSASKECIICHHWYFLDKRYHDVLMMSMNLMNISILNNHGVDYRFIINRIRKSEAMGLLNNANLNEKSGTL